MEKICFEVHLVPPLEMLPGDALGYTEHLSPLLSLLMDEFTSLHHTLLTLLPPRSLCDSTSQRVLLTWLGLMPPAPPPLLLSTSFSFFLLLKCGLIVVYFKIMSPGMLPIEKIFF